MQLKMKKSTFGRTKDGTKAQLFRIPNNTEDYIEVSTYGCAIKGIFIHNREGKLQNVFCGMETLRNYELSVMGNGSIVGAVSKSSPSAAHAHKVWDVAEVGENFVFLTCRESAEESGCGCEVTIGVQIMWVNLNRLIVDAYVTPEKDAEISLECRCFFKLQEAERDGYGLRTFAQEVIGEDGPMGKTENTPFRNLSFQPLPHEVTFLSRDPQIKPMAELASTQSQITISAYSSMVSLLAKKAEELGGVEIQQGMHHAVFLKSGETLTGRVIYGFDKLYSKDEVENPEPTPFSALCK
ncbi:hypothetical protein OBV_33460 [Oscillibacter valericigenes Sjm18-20]|nr:hypothetical protein OBV_33460 [Oscillibacter valericigenes Sjm18-20]